MVGEQFSDIPNIYLCNTLISCTETTHKYYFFSLATVDCWNERMQPSLMSH